MAQNEIITVKYNSGDIVVYDMAAFCSQLPFGNSLLTESRLVVSNLDDGLWLNLYSYSYTPSDTGSCGLETHQQPAASLQLLTAKELAEVSQISMAGEPILFNLDGTLLNLAKLNRAAQIYTTPDTIAGGYYSVIQDIYYRMQEEVNETLAQETGKDIDDIDETETQNYIAQYLGLTFELLQRSLAWQPPIAPPNE
jgi:hypothetical protein